MSMSSKHEFIAKVLPLICKTCSRRIRIEKRLYEELDDNDFDFEKDQKTAKIISEEA